MAPAKSTDPKDLLIGGVLQSLEAATLGMPFEVWKTHMGTYRSESTIQAFKSIYNKGGAAAFWSGLQPKLVESFLKGGILLFSKESIIRFSAGLGANEVSAGLIGGFGGGIAQVSIMGPCTFLVTAAVTGDKSVTLLQRVRQTYAKNGISGFYHGGTALALRQGTNWASRQGFTDVARAMVKKYKYNNDKKAKLSVLEEALCGTIGGTLAVWNQPFEVMRIEAQSAITKGLPLQNFRQTFQTILQQDGVGGFFKGVVPRIGICIW